MRFTCQSLNPFNSERSPVIFPETPSSETLTYLPRSPVRRNGFLSSLNSVGFVSVLLIGMAGWSIGEMHRISSPNDYDSNSDEEHIEESATDLNRGTIQVTRLSEPESSGTTAPTQVDSKAYTPERGSLERVAISDSMRAHVIKAYGNKKLPKFLFKIEFIRVKGDYAGFQGNPVKPDGSHFPDGIFEDVVHTTLMIKKNGVWQVAVDLSRSDVPSAQETRQIKQSIPAGFPSEVMPAFWREHLKI